MEQSSLVPSVDVGTFVPQTPISEMTFGQEQYRSFAAQPQTSTVNTRVGCEGNQFNGLSSPPDMMSTSPSDVHPGDMQPSNVCEEFGYQYGYPQQGYTPYNPYFAGYYGFVNDSSCYNSGYASPVANETHFQGYSRMESSATSLCDGTQQLWPQPQMLENRYTRSQVRPRQVQRPPRRSLPVKVIRRLPQPPLRNKKKPTIRFSKNNGLTKKVNNLPNFLLRSERRHSIV